MTSRERFLATMDFKQPDIPGKKQVAAGGLKGAAGGANTADASETTHAADENPRWGWADRWGSFFGSLRNMMGVERLCCVFYDQPELDHSVPPDISWPVFCEYMDYLKHRLGRG